MAFGFVSRRTQLAPPSADIADRWMIRIISDDDGDGDAERDRLLERDEEELHRGESSRWMATTNAVHVYDGGTDVCPDHHHLRTRARPA